MSDQASGNGRGPKGDRSEPVFVGVDDGYAMTKVALPDGQMLKIPSKARSGVHGVSVFGKADNGVLDGGYETENQRFTVTEHVDGEGTRFDEYPFSALNRVVVHHALRAAGLGGKAVKIATGLPVAHFYAAGMPNIAVLDRKSKSLQTPVTTLSGNPVASIVASFVVPEGVAAWVDHCVSDGGEIVASIGRPAAVVDIGGRTTDCVTVLPGWKVDHARTGTTNKGVLDLCEQIATRVRAKFDLPDVPLQAIEEAIQSGQLVLWNKPHDISEIVGAAKREIAESILREIQRRIGRAHDLERVLFVGGGAVVFDELRARFPNADVAKQPEYANARGMLKYMKYVV